MGDRAYSLLDRVLRRRLHANWEDMVGIVVVVVGHMEVVLRTMDMVLDGQHSVASVQLPNQLRTALWADRYWGVVDVAFRDPINKSKYTFSVLNSIIRTAAVGCTLLGYFQRNMP